MITKKQWQSIFLGKLTREQIRKAIKEKAWQELWESLKGKSLEYKYYELWYWFFWHQPNEQARIQVTNYVNALKRGGFQEQDKILYRGIWCR